MILGGTSPVVPPLLANHLLSPIGHLGRSEFPVTPIEDFVVKQSLSLGLVPAGSESRNEVQLGDLVVRRRTVGRTCCSLCKIDVADSKGMARDKVCNVNDRACHGVVDAVSVQEPGPAARP